MKKRVAVITSTRAEFGLLLPVIKELKKHENNEFEVHLVVTGTHLSEEYGHTVDEIEKFDLQINHIITIPVKTSSSLDISNNQAQTLVKFTELFEKEKYNAIVILGDRYEMLAVAIAAGNTHTPICHLCGGDTTEGAIDEWIRHSISKMSYLHFVTNEESYRRIIQLGEDPSRVFNYGSTSIDNAINIANVGKEEALNSLGLNNCDYAICTYHPVTMEDGDIKGQIDDFLQAIISFPEIQFIVTKSNADQGGALINELLDHADSEIDNLHVYSSLGVVRYLSLMKCAEFVLGNSSSGIIEAPAFKVPVVNIGDRQKGRLQAGNIINCESDKESIIEAIKHARSKEFKEICNNIVCPYGDGHAAEKIAAKIFTVISKENINLKKSFYNLNNF